MAGLAAAGGVAAGRPRPPGAAPATPGAAGPGQADARSARVPAPRCAGGPAQDRARPLRIPSAGAAAPARAARQRRHGGTGRANRGEAGAAASAAAPWCPAARRPPAAPPPQASAAANVPPPRRHRRRRPSPISLPQIGDRLRRSRLREAREERQADTRGTLPGTRRQQWRPRRQCRWRPAARQPSAISAPEIGDTACRIRLRHWRCQRHGTPPGSRTACRARFGSVQQRSCLEVRR